MTDPSEVKPISPETEPSSPIEKVDQSFETNLQGPVPLADVPATVSSKKNDWPTILQFVCSLVAIFTLWGFAFLIAMLGLMNQTAFNMPAASGSLFIQGFGLAATGVMLLPSAITSLRRLLGRPLPYGYQPVLNIHPLVILIAIPIVLGLGYLASQNEQIAFWTIPFLHVLAVVLPVLFLINLGVKGLSTGSPQRRSGVFGAGLVLGPMIIMLVEVLALLLVIIVVVVGLMSQPQNAERFMDLVRQLPLSQNDPESLMKTFSPYLTNPWVILGVLAFSAVFVPLVEEFLKPIGVWLLFGRRLTAAEGFAAGALSGAGYAIFESLALSGGGGETWLLVVSARMGTAVIHVATTAFTGWALASSWRDHRYGRVLLTYLGVVMVHGLWNASTMLAFFGEAAKETHGSMSVLPIISTIAPFILAALTIGGFIVFLGMNRRLRPPPQSSVILE